MAFNCRPFTSASLLALGWGQDLNAVGGSQLGEADRVGRGGLGQPQVVGWPARCRDELVESSWRDDHDDPPGAGLGDVEAVRDAVRQEHQRAGPGLPRLISAESFEVAI